MMTIKRIVFITMCVLLVLVIITSCVVISRVSRLFRPSQPSVSTTPSTAPITPPTHPTEGSGTTTQPSLPEPTEHEHEYVLSEKISASCENYGWTIFTCKLCGDIDMQDQADPLGHSFGHGKVIEVTCTERGYTEFTCSRCGKTELRNEVAPLGHSFDEGTEILASCTQDACTEFQCLICGEIKYENVQVGSAMGHDFSDWLPGEDGNLYRYCLTCRETQSAPDITNESTDSATDVSGVHYLVYVITVGTAEDPGAYTYTIHDYLHNGTLTYYYDPLQGLILSFTDADGMDQSYALDPQVSQTFTIDASGSTAGG